MSRRIKVAESERSPFVVSSIWKQRVILERNIRVLDTNQRMVVNRITLNQKIVFKAFKKKLHQAKLSHARIMGDKEAEKELRDNPEHMFSHMNTNLGNDPDDEEVLKKIWNRGIAMRERQVQQDKERATRSRMGRTIKSAPAGSGSAGLLSRPKLYGVRPQTVATKHPQLSTNSQSMYISTGQIGQTGQQDRCATVPPTLGTHDTADIGQDTSKRVRLQRPKTTGSNIAKTEPTSGKDRAVTPARKTAQFLATVVNDDEDDNYYSDDDESLISPGRMTSSRQNPSSSRDAGKADDAMATTIFDDDDRQTRLLEMQRERVKSANYEEKVKRMCQKMSPYLMPKHYVVQDYYQTCMAKDSRALRGTKTFDCQTSVNQEAAEVRKSIGNLTVKNMTLKRLDYNFNSNNRRDSMGVA